MNWKIHHHIAMCVWYTLSRTNLCKNAIKIKIKTVHTSSYNKVNFKPLSFLLHFTCTTNVLCTHKHTYIYQRMNVS